MAFMIDHARLTDIDELLKLYFSIYGNTYPIAYGTDPKKMAETISSDHFRWVVTRESERQLIVASTVYELDLLNRVGKLTALVVHPEYRKHNLALNLVKEGEKGLLDRDGPLNTIYTTTRTNSVGPQLVCLRAGYVPLGIFPNAHKLGDYETTTLLAKFRPGVLETRPAPGPIPAKLGPIYRALHAMPELATVLGPVPPTLEASPAPVAPVSSGLPPASPRELEFEMFYAPEFVRKRFHEIFLDPYDRFFPFHQPNLLVAAKDGSVEVYAHLSKPDRYCAIVALTQPIHSLGGRMRKFLAQVHDEGISYVEVLIGIEHTASIETLLNAQFLPSALYPGFRTVEGRAHDFVIMTRTMEPLDFRGMAVEQRFKPFIDQYVDLWKRMHLDTLQIFNVPAPSDQEEEAHGDA